MDLSMFAASAEWHWLHFYGSYLSTRILRFFSLLFLSLLARIHRFIRAFKQSIRRILRGFPHGVAPRETQGNLLKAVMLLQIILQPLQHKPDSLLVYSGTDHCEVIATDAIAFACIRKGILENMGGGVAFSVS